MPGKNTMTRVVLVAYTVGCVAVAIPLLAGMAHSGELASTTSGKILAAALLALGLGAALAIRNPWRNRIMVQVLIVFTALSCLAITYRLACEDHANDPAWILLVLAVAATAVLAVFYPRRPGD